MPIADAGHRPALNPLALSLAHPSRYSPNLPQIASPDAIIHHSYDLLHTGVRCFPLVIAIEQQTRDAEITIAPAVNSLIIPRGFFP